MGSLFGKLSQWKKLHGNWEETNFIRQQYPSLCLEDKAAAIGCGIDRNIIPMPLGQQAIKKSLRVYTRRPKGPQNQTLSSFRRGISRGRGSYLRRENR